MNRPQSAAGMVCTLSRRLQKSLALCAIEANRYPHIQSSARTNTHASKKKKKEKGAWVGPGRVEGEFSFSSYATVNRKRKLSKTFFFGRNDANASVLAEISRSRASLSLPCLCFPLVLFGTAPKFSAWQKITLLFCIEGGERPHMGPTAYACCSVL